MKIPIYQVDAFTSSLFGGNPAAVCPLDEWPADNILQAIAAENNLAETAFFVKLDGGYHIRWFTPLTEVDLCGHATLASAFVIMRFLTPGSASVDFESLSGRLGVRDRGERLELDFPADHARPIDPPAMLRQAIQFTPAAWYQGKAKYLFVLNNEDEVRRAQPDLGAIKNVTTGDGLIISARGSDCDFVSRYFAPHAGIDEDPVTGSAHSLLAPYWAGQLGKTRLHARQISQRGGELHCELKADRVLISGSAVLYMQGTIEL